MKSKLWSVHCLSKVGRFLKDFRDRIFEDCIDIFILAELCKGNVMSGYDFLKFFFKEFGVMLSSGTVYSKLYAMQRRGILRGKMESRRVLYSLSEEYSKNIHIILNLNLKLREFVKSLDSDL